MREHPVVVMVPQALTNDGEIGFVVHTLLIYGNE
jgi:hypothetical protein